MKILVLVGPTGVGKTALSIAVAEALDAEIISADSRQIYRYMDIGTAKPPREFRNKIVHHFIDIVNPDQTYSAGLFGSDGRATIEAIGARRKTVMVVGGSGLRIRSLTEGFFGEEVKDEKIRSGIREEIKKNGTAVMHQKLATVDPESAVRISPKDAKRIERALEVYAITGKPMSVWFRSQDNRFSFEPVFYGLTCDRAELYRRIETRVDQMLENGVIEETLRLLAMGYSQDLVSMESLGYREIISFLENKISKDEMIRLFKQGSRNYAKRQLTWFRKDARIQWLDVTKPESLSAAGETIIQSFRKYL